MAVISSIAVTALTVAGAISGGNIEPEPYDFYDPLGYTEYNILNGEEKFDYNNNVASIIANDKVMEVTNVTVLTHGIGGDAGYWLSEKSENKYLEFDDCLPFKLCNSDERIGDLSFPLNHEVLNVYEFGYSKRQESNTDPTLIYGSIPLQRLADKGDYFEFVDYPGFRNIDTNSQIVLIYEGNMGDNDIPISDYNAYKSFEEALNTVISGIAAAQYGYLPSLNLIGHSRGGLINLLYAINYPTIVNNLISLGTPYMGSQWADLYVDFLKLTDENNAEIAVYEDMLNPAHINEYSQAFNRVNRLVNSYAIGFGQTNNYFVDSINKIINGGDNSDSSNTSENNESNNEENNEENNEDNNNSFMDKLAEDFSKITGGLLTKEQCFNIAERYMDSLLDLKTFFIAGSGDILFDNNAFLEFVLGDFFGDTKVGKLMDVLNEFSDIIKEDAVYDNDYGVTSIESDICVNLDSQLGFIRGTTGEQFLFKKRDVINLGDSSNNNYFNYEHCSAPEKQWVAHNFETKSPVAISKIIDFLNNHDGFHEHQYVSSSTSTTHYRNCFCGVYQIEEENHTMVYDYLNETTHRYNCSHAQCSYFNDLPHNFTYTKLNDLEHKKECEDCGYLLNNDHLLNIYVMNDTQTHTSYCACGLVGETSLHNTDNILGKCTYCGFEVKDPVYPIVPPIEIEPTPIV